MLRRTEGLEHEGMLLWDVSLCNLLAWTIIFLVLTKGVETLGKVWYIIFVCYSNVKSKIVIEFVYNVI